MEIRPFRTDLPIRFEFLSSFYPEGRDITCYLLWFNSMNHGEVSRHKLELTETEITDPSTGELIKVWDTLFRGVDQRKLGDYHAVIIIDENKTGQQQYTVEDMFHLDLVYNGEYDDVSLRVVVKIGALQVSPEL